MRVFLCPVERTEHRQPATVEHMGIDLRGLYIRVAKQLLHGANILTAFQQMRGKRMPQGMRRRRLVQTDPAHGITHRPLNGLLMQVMTENTAGTRIKRTIDRRKHELPTPLSR